ncbi:flavoprotein [Actinosynnema sp. NPDC053489]|uniref:flavoprotein n=1 Tax=Actinosynnema sp. NPDC053489 TaxID=3363916 RepID=UPI0037C64EA5
MTERVLYLMVCGAGPADHVRVAVDLVRGKGWSVHCVATPAAAEHFLDLGEPERLTGHPVRTGYQRQGQPALPKADAVVVAPATYNTINKWTAGIADTYVLTQLAELAGLGVPIAVLPFVNTAFAANPVLHRSIDTLRPSGVEVLFGGEGFRPHAPRSGGGDGRKLCWTDAEREQVQEGAHPLEVVFLNPDDPITDPTNVLGQFDRDMYQVLTASAVVVDARERRGSGVGGEMAAAIALGTPVIVVAPRDSGYRRDRLDYRGAFVHDYVHPHVAAPALAVVDGFAEAGEVPRALPAAPGIPRVIPAWLRASTDECRSTVLAGDRPMLDALHRPGVDP